MRRKPMILVIYFGILLIAGNQSAVGRQSRERADDCAKESIYRLWTQVSILSDSVYDSERNVEVQLDERVFTTCALRWVFGIVSRRYPAPIRLHVSVQNAMDDTGAVSQPWAEYRRDERGEALRYKPNPSYNGVRMTVTSGSNPFERAKIKR